MINLVPPSQRQNEIFELFPPRFSTSCSSRRWSRSSLKSFCLGWILSAFDDDGRRALSTTVLHVDNADPPVWFPKPPLSKAMCCLLLSSSSGISVMLVIIWSGLSKDARIRRLKEVDSFICNRTYSLVGISWFFFQTQTWNDVCFALV